MLDVFVVQIIGAQVACSGGVKDSWRGVAALTAEQLARHFEGRVRVEYYDLFDPACPQMPQDAQLPLVLVQGEVFSSGGKISVPGIRTRLEELGLEKV